MIKSIRHNDSIQYINIPTPIYLDSCVESVKYRRTDQTDCTILSCTRKKNLRCVNISITSTLMQDLYGPHSSL